MARAFVSASSQYLERTSAVLTAVPLTLACWFNPAANTAAQILMALWSQGTANNGFRLIVRGDLPGDPLESAVASNGVFEVAESTSPTVVGQWHHGCGVFASNTRRTVYLDGKNSATNTGNRTPASVDRTLIGARRNSGGIGLFFDGQIGEAGIWNIALDAAEVASLASGASPLLVRPESLVAYWPLIGRYSPETDEFGAFDLTVTGAANADHPRIIYPRRTRIWQPPVAAVAGSLRRLLLLGAG